MTLSDLLKNDDVGDDVKEQAYGICQEFLVSPWKDITINQFKISSIA